MYISLSGGSIDAIARELEDFVRDYLSHYESELYNKLLDHEHGGESEIELTVEEVASDMAEELHGDMEAIVSDYFERHSHWQSDARENLEDKLNLADQELEENP